jgi:hypothetical protein
VFDDAYIKRKDSLVCYQFLKELRKRFGENPYSQMVQDGIKMLVNGQD